MLQKRIASFRYAFMLRVVEVVVMAAAAAVVLLLLLVEVVVVRGRRVRRSCSSAHPSSMLLLLLLERERVRPRPSAVDLAPLAGDEVLGAARELFLVLFFVVGFFLS